LTRVVSAALVAAVLVGAFGPSALEATAARKRVSPKLQQSFSNTTPITIHDIATAQTSIFVSGFQTEIADVNVTLNNVSIGLASDLDLLLVGPGGRTALILSDVGGNNAANNVTLTLDDQAPNQVSSSNPLTGGTFQPTNFDSGDSFNPPAPTTSSSSSKLGVFNSSDPNGTWNLFLKDDRPGGAEGALAGGWSLNITSSNGVPNTEPDSFQAQAGQTLTVPTAGVLGNDSDPDGDTLTAVLAGQPKQGTVDLQSDGAFTYRPKKNAKGKDSFTYLAQDPTGLTALDTVSIQIKGKKHKKHK
jgi:subtilisin-like proprotein convertase family protein